MGRLVLALHVIGGVFGVSQTMVPILVPPRYFWILIKYNDNWSLITKCKKNLM